MIVFNTHQLNHFYLKNKSQQRPANFNSQFEENVKLLNNVNEHSDNVTSSQNTVTGSLINVNISDDRSNGSHFFKQKFSLLATFAIRQYETFASIESQQTKTSMLGVNEYA